MCPTAAGPASRSCRPAALRVWVERGAFIRDVPAGKRSLESDTETEPAKDTKCAHDHDHDDGGLASGPQRELLLVVSGPCETASQGADARARAPLCPPARPRSLVTLCAPRIALAPTRAAALREVPPHFECPHWPLAHFLFSPCLFSTPGHCVTYNMTEACVAGVLLPASYVCAGQASSPGLHRQSCQLLHDSSSVGPRQCRRS